MLYFYSNKYSKAQKAYEQREGSKKPSKRPQQQQKDDELDIIIKKILQA